MRTPIAFGLMVTAGGLLGLLIANVQEARQFVLPTSRAQLDAVPASFAPTLAQASALSTSTVLEAPRYTGRTVDGTLYTVQASRADQHGDISASTLLLYDLEARYAEPSRTDVLYAQAVKGTFDQAREHLMLLDTTLHQGTMRLTAPQADLDLRSRTAEGKDLVLSAPWQDGHEEATVRANHFFVDQAQSRINLKGDVRVELP